MPFSPFTSFVAVLQTLKASQLHFLYHGAQKCAQYLLHKGNFFAQYLCAVVSSFNSKAYPKLLYT